MARWEGPGTTHLSQSILAAAFKDIAFTIKGDKVAIPIGHTCTHAGLVSALPPAVPAGAGEGKATADKGGCPGPVLACHFTWGIKLTEHQALVLVSNNPRLDKRPLLHKMELCKYLGSQDTY